MLIGAMILPGTPSLVFLFYVVLLLPWMAFRSSRRLKQQPELLADGRVRRRVWKSTVLMLLLLLWMAAATGRGFGYDVFEVPEDVAGTVWKSLLSLAVSMLLIVLIALQMHWLVQSTGSLLGAMAAHTLYDIVAMFWIARQAKRDAVIASL